MMLSESERIFNKAQRHLVGGASAAGRIHGILKRPLFLSKAEGALLIDVEGNEYIDFHNSSGAAFFGYGHPRLRNAVEKALDMGFFMNHESKYQGELAEQICTAIPSAEYVRLSNTGTEATLAAVRLARAYTGREKIIKFEGHFHGMHESCFFNHGTIGDMSPDGEVHAIADSAGFPRNLEENVVVLEFNNITALEMAFQKYREEIAAVIMEPISFNCGCLLPQEGYLQKVRELCTKEDTILIFDEVLSGFRMGIGGAQEYYSVTPDLTTLAKALGGGFPIAAIVGREEVMRCLNPTGNTIVSGTYTGALMSVLAALECLEMMKADGFYDSLNQRADDFYSEFNHLLQVHGIPGHVRGVGARFAVMFGVESYDDDYSFRSIARKFNPEIAAIFVREALAEGLFFHIGGWTTGGVSLPTHCGITAVHSQEILEEALKKIDVALVRVAKQIR